MRTKTKDFDCIQFKNDLAARAWENSKAKTLREYVDYANREALKSPLHREYAAQR
ncbi:MAG: hypothetical protein LBQ83_06280 [Candidatus Margulisbacteria bacterium]|jgi:Arc/MetJ family transcription regulator|nr:hypothetical protein [Candidatus Margulisiibacteriota bacterium]